MWILSFLFLYSIYCVKICNDNQTPENGNCYYYGGLKEAIILGSGASGLSTGLLLLKWNVTDSVTIFEGKPTSPIIPNEIYSVGGCIDTFRIPYDDDYLGKAHIGFHWWSMTEEAWVSGSLERTIGAQQWDFLDEVQAYYVFQGYNADGTDKIVGLQGGFIELIIPSSGRRSVKEGNEYLCVDKDSGESYYSNACEDGLFKISTMYENVLTTSKSKYNDYVNYYRHPNNFDKPTRRYTKDESIFIPGFAFSMIMADPAYEGEVWAFFDYSLGIMFGMIEPEDLPGNEVVNSLLTSIIHRKMVKIPIMTGMLNVNEIKFDGWNWVGLMLYQFLSRTTFIRGGPEYVKKQFYDYIVDNGGEFFTNSKVTKFVYDNVYENSDDQGEDEPMDDTIPHCPRMFSFSVCKEQCNGDIECKRGCKSTRNKCAGKRRANGVIVNGDTYYKSNFIFTSAGHYQNYKVLSEDVSAEFNYDEVYTSEVKHTTGVHYLWSSHDGSPVDHGLQNADYYIFPLPHEDYGVTVNRMEYAEEYTEETKFPWVWFTGSSRDTEWQEQNPNNMYINSVAHVGRKIWATWEDSVTHQRPAEYYELKDKVTNDMIDIIKKSFPIEFAEGRIEHGSALTQRDYLYYGYNTGAMSTGQNTIRTEEGLPKFHMRGVDNILVMGNDYNGPGLPVVINSGADIVKFAEEKDDEAVF
jgi:hypothetical protein